jgi:hypothetical protein
MSSHRDEGGLKDPDWFWVKRSKSARDRVKRYFSVPRAAVTNTPCEIAFGALLLGDDGGDQDKLSVRREEDVIRKGIEKRVIETPLSTYFIKKSRGEWS